VEKISCDQQVNYQQNNPVLMDDFSAGLKKQVYLRLIAVPVVCW